MFVHILLYTVILAATVKKISSSKVVNNNNFLISLGPSEITADELESSYCEARDFT